MKDLSRTEWLTGQQWVLIAPHAIAVLYAVFLMIFWFVQQQGGPHFSLLGQVGITAIWLVTAGLVYAICYAWIIALVSYGAWRLRSFRGVLPVYWVVVTFGMPAMILCAREWSLHINRCNPFPGGECTQDDLNRFGGPIWPHVFDDQAPVLCAFVATITVSLPTFVNLFRTWKVRKVC